jgi:hypothetical protein
VWAKKIEKQIQAGTDVRELTAKAEAERQAERLVSAVSEKCAPTWQCTWSSCAVFSLPVCHHALCLLFNMLTTPSLLHDGIADAHTCCRGR